MRRKSSTDGLSRKPNIASALLPSRILRPIDMSDAGADGDDMIRDGDDEMTAMAVAMVMTVIMTDISDTIPSAPI